MAESLHKYYMYPKSVSQQFDDKRIASDPILFDNACDFLLSKCGAVSHENLNFLFHVYLNAIQDTMKVLLNAQLSVTDKLYRLQDIFQSQQTQKLAQWTGGAEEQKKMLFGQVAQWILSQEEVRSGTGMELAAEMLATMGIYPTQIGGWQDSGVFLLLAKIKDRRMEMGIADAQIVSSTSKSPLLAGLDAGFLIFFRDIVFSILQQEEEKALRQIEDKIAQGTDIPVEYIEAFLILGLNLSAKLEYTDDYIYFKKLQISLLIDLSRTDEARMNLQTGTRFCPMIRIS
ncbi:hypothetical protein [Desulforamulus profundi]|nr:hypothetical protein [Desulforamulus profundi]